MCIACVCVIYVVCACVDTHLQLLMHIQEQMQQALYQTPAPPFGKPLPLPPHQSSNSHRRRTRQANRQSSSEETDIYEGIHPAKPPSGQATSVVKSNNENRSDIDEYEELPEEIQSKYNPSMSLPPLPPPRPPSLMKSDTEEEEEEGYQPLVPTHHDTITREDVSEKVPDDSHNINTPGLESESAAQYIDKNELDNELVNNLPAKPPAPVSNGNDKSPSSEANKSDHNETDEDDYYKDFGALVDNDNKDEDKDYDDKDDSDDRELTTMLHENSVSEMVVSELLQSIISERESIVKTVELQKSQLQHELSKTHELEIKELQLKYKSRFKKLRLKHKEEGLALKTVVEELQSELTGVYEQNSKLTRYMKESYRREEKFNKAITRLQQTVNSLESELASVRGRETDLLTNIEMLKERLRKYELT